MTTEASACDVEALVISEGCAQADALSVSFHSDRAVRETCVKQRRHCQDDYQRKVREIISRNKGELDSKQIQQLEQCKYELNQILSSITMTEDEEEIAAEREAQALKQFELQAKQKRAEQEQQERENELRSVQQKLSMLAVKHEEAMQNRAAAHKESLEREKRERDAELQTLGLAAQVTASHDQHKLAMQQQELTIKQQERCMLEKMHAIEQKQYEENIALMEAMIAHAQKAKELEATHSSLKNQMKKLGLDCAKLIEQPQTPPGKIAPPSAERSARVLQPLAAANTPSAAKVQLPA